MWRSEHKKARPNRKEPGGDQRVPTFGSNKMSGNAGAKHTKRHIRAQSRPGTPNGVCLGAGKQIIDGVRVELSDLCRCGKHNVRGKA